jgi:MFS family permease
MNGPDTLPPYRRRSVIVATLGITQTLAWGSTYYLPAVMADPICDSLHLPRSWFFGIFSAALLLSGLLGPIAGRMIDRHGGRDVLACTNLVFAAGLMLLAAASSVVGLFLAWTVIGIGMGSASTKRHSRPLPASTAVMPVMRSPALRCSPALPARSAGPRARCSWTLSAGGVPVWFGRRFTLRLACL